MCTNKLKHCYIYSRKMGTLDVVFVLTMRVLVYHADVTHAQQPTTSICQTMQYRALTAQLQSEHQCMILEQLQRQFEVETHISGDRYQELYTMISKFQTAMQRNVAAMKTPSRDSAKSIPTLKDIPLVRDCSELYENGITLGGVYAIRLPNRNIVNVWCDMETSHGGWTLIQRRLDGSVNFTRKWNDYAFGFGNVNSEYWLGNENLYWLSHYKNLSIRFDLWDWNDVHAYALYDYFRVENEQNHYQLTITGYSGTAGDAMTPYHHKMKFSTIDRDNDEWYASCARKDESGWWFKACGLASLNGLYVPNGINEMTPDGLVKGIIWSKWKNEFGYSMKRSEIKIKPQIQVHLDRLKDDTDYSYVDSYTEYDASESDVVETDEAHDELATVSSETDSIESEYIDGE